MTRLFQTYHQRIVVRRRHRDSNETLSDRLQELPDSLTSFVAERFELLGKLYWYIDGGAKLKHSPRAKLVGVKVVHADGDNFEITVGFRRDSTQSHDGDSGCFMLAGSFKEDLVHTF
jgi:hypothetical protein